MDIIARAIAAQNSKKTGVYTYNTDVGLRRWRSALARVKAGTGQIVNVSCLGDSISEGAHATSWVSGGFLGRINTELIAKYGDVGRGFIPVFFGNASPYWTFTGTWANYGTFGITASNKSSTIINSTATFAFNGTGVSIIVVKGPICGNFLVSIDGGSTTEYNTYNASVLNAFSIDITGLGTGDHTLVITQNEAGKNVILLGAYEIKGTSGVRINRCCRYGTTVSHAMTYETAQYTEIDFWSPVLTIIAYLANDCGTGTNLSIYENNLQTLITRAKIFGDVLLVANGLHSTTINETQYASVMMRLALSNNVAFVDIVNRWGADGSYATNTLGFLSDSVHPNDYGHQDMATAIINALEI